jgi:3-oxoacyl-[acyl-carrier protein] reductase
VSPGTVSSEWFDRLVGSEKAAVSRVAEADRIPLGAVTAPEDVADMVVNLLAARHTTGQDVIVDGGKHLRY